MQEHNMFFKVRSLAVILLFLAGCAPPKVLEYQDSYTVMPTLAQVGSVSFTFAGKSVGVDNYAVYYSKTLLEDPLTAPPSAVTLTTYAIDDSLKLQIDKLEEERIYYVWVYAKRGAEVIDALPLQTVYPYTKIKDYQLVNEDGNAKATWIGVSGAKEYSLFKKEDRNNSLLAKDVAEESLLLENKLSDQDSSYVVAYDTDGDVLAESNSVIYDITLSLSLNAEAGVFPSTVKLRWTEDVGAASYDIIYSEVDSDDASIPSTEKIINIDPLVNGIVGVDPLDTTLRTVSYLVENLTAKRYVYRVKGKNSAGKDSQFSGSIIAEPKQNLVLEPFVAVNTSAPYEMKITWNREYANVRDLNGKSLEDHYSGIKYELDLTRPSDIPATSSALAGTVLNYAGTGDELSYTQSAYSVTINDSAEVPVYARIPRVVIGVSAYRAQLRFVGVNKITGASTVLGEYEDNVMPAPLQRYDPLANFDGIDKVTFSGMPLPSAVIENYYRIKDDTKGYDDIPAISALTLLPSDNILDFGTTSLSSLADKDSLFYEIWTTVDGVLASLGAGSTTTIAKSELRLNAGPDAIPGSIRVFWNASYVLEKSSFTLSWRKGGPTPGLWVNLSTTIPASTTSYTIFDADLEDESARRFNSYDIRLTPNTAPDAADDEVTITGIYPTAPVLLASPTPAADLSATNVNISVDVYPKYLLLGTEINIGSITNLDGTTFQDHFASSTRLKYRSIFKRPLTRSSSVSEFRSENSSFAFGSASSNIAVNDMPNVEYRNVVDGRAYSDTYGFRYELIDTKDTADTADDQILGSSAEIEGLKGGYLTPVGMGSTLVDTISLNPDAHRRITPLRFINDNMTGSSYQIVYITEAAGHTIVPVQPSDIDIDNTRQIYKIPAGDARDDFRNDEYDAQLPVQVYTYTSTGQLVGARSYLVDDLNVLEIMYWFNSSAVGYTGSTDPLPFEEWAMPYLYDRTNDHRYYFRSGNVIAIPSSGKRGQMGLGIFLGFTIDMSFVNGTTYGHRETFTISEGTTFNGFKAFFTQFANNRRYLPPSNWVAMYLYNPATGERFGRGVGDHSQFGNFTNFETTKPAGYVYPAEIH